MSEVTLHRIEGRGMIAVRAEFDRDPAKNAVTKVTGAAFPGPLRITFNDQTALGWMAPDEALVFLPHGDAASTADALGKVLSRQHALVQDVSDARVIFRLVGPGARAVLARLTPADVGAGAFGPGDFRRTRLGQIAAGIWVRDDGAIGVMCFASVATYLRDLLENAVASERAQE